MTRVQVRPATFVTDTTAKSTYGRTGRWDDKGDNQATEFG